MVALCRILIGEKMLQTKKIGGCTTFRSGYAVFSADSSFFIADVQFFDLKGWILKWKPVLF